MEDKLQDYKITSVKLAEDGYSLTIEAHLRTNPTNTMNCTFGSDCFVRAPWIAERLHRFERALKHAHDILTGREP